MKLFFFFCLVIVCHNIFSQNNDTIKGYFENSEYYQLFDLSPEEFSITQQKLNTFDIKSAKKYYKLYSKAKTKKEFKKVEEFKKKNCSIANEPNRALIANFYFYEINKRGFLDKPCLSLIQKDYETEVVIYFSKEDFNKIKDRLKEKFIFVVKFIFIEPVTNIKAYYCLQIITQ